MTLIKELIHIPEKVQRGDFVLNLSQGLQDEAIHQTLAEYVVTSELTKAFEDALSFIKSTVVGGHNAQKGAYLHGSFGSGKSHFMAVLHLLLQGNSEARAIPELAPAVSKHDDWLQQRNILLVPYHMIGAPSIEAGVLGGYVRYIRKLHPEAPTPGFYLSERLFKDAEELRQRIGDEVFFKALNQDAAVSSDDGWGELAEGWDSLSFAAVINGQTDDDEKARLVGDLVRTLFTSVADMANNQAGGYVDFDEGLRIMTQHAKGLGYDAVVLFLDELILWLASHIADQQFIASNIQKVVKLVEPSETRALPMASFIARQRDLKEFVGDHMVGASQVALSDSLKYWDGRFHTITLEDRNLPVIAQRRLLKPVDEAARQKIQQAFEAIDASLKEEVNNVLLTTQGDREMFRNLYPFSPALVQALVALSSALQRERTALKVMLMLLVEQRDTLELGGVIPVGDLYDVIASEAEPFSEQMRNHFDNAKQLFERKLLPLLEREHDIAYTEVRELPVTDPKRRGFDNDLRLLKTLLLAALAPEVECFKQLTSQKLAALNHGTIRSPIPGQEARTVLAKCRKWAGQVGEIKIADDAHNPTIAVQISGVDTESILEQAQIHDSEGARRKLTKDLVFEAFGIEEDNQLFLEHPFQWRGTRRTVEVQFQNIREIEDDTVFEARGDDWKVIVDFPFDSGTHSPADDRARVQLYQERNSSSRTLCWLPYFFSSTLQRDLGVLVRLEYVLKNSDRFLSFSKHLSPVDRTQAQTLLDNQRSQLRQRIKDALLSAYGASEAPAGVLDDDSPIPEQIMSLAPGFTPRLPHGANLRQAFTQLLDQALRYQYPDHPEFDTEVKPADVGKVFEELRRAIHATNHRIDVDSPLRPLMRGIAQPLELGTMHERHFIFSDSWPQRLRRAIATDGRGDAALTVERLREAINQPTDKGLPELLQNLLIMVFAEHGQYAFVHHGQDYSPSLREMPDNLTLLPQALAEPQDWKAAIDKAGALFGLTPKPLRTANHQSELVKELHEQVRHSLAAAELLLEQLQQQLSRLAQPLTGNRCRTAEYAVKLLHDLQNKEGVELVRALAESQPPSSDQALGKSLMSAREIAGLLQNNNWTLLEKVWSGGTPEGQAIKRRVTDALNADELAQPLAQVLRKAQIDATDLISTSRPPAPSPAPTPAPAPTPGTTMVKQESRKGLNLRDARNLFSAIEAELEEGVYVDISYTIVKRGDSAL